VREPARIDHGDGRWCRRWPVGALTGRFAPHRGHFDPGQRLANVAFVATLGTLIGSGVALTTLSGGPTFATLVRVHRGATYVLTVLVVGHVVVVSGVLPGYRGAWRAMVGRGRVPAATARRLWPGAGSHRHRD
jgi:formate dehydrogenase subunit gamma